MLVILPYRYLWRFKGVKRGNRIEVEIMVLNAKGDGVAYVEDREIVVRRAVPGDRVSVRLVKKRKGRFEAEIEEFSTMGYERQNPRCGHFGLCGGCRWQELAYEDQLKVKEGMVANALAKLQSPSIEPILASPTSFDYRNKMEFSFGIDPEGVLQLGLHLRGRFNRVFDVEECHLQSSLSNRIVESVRRSARELEIIPYDLKRHQGILRFLVIRDAKKTGQVMVNLVVASYPNREVDLLIERVLSEIAEIDVLLVTLHTGKAQVAVGEKEFLIKGKGHIVESCSGFEFDISPQAFFQTNPRQAERLYEVVAQMAGKSGTVLDVYCGTGSISLILARQAEFVLGIEVVEEAVDNAKYNAERNGVDNCEFVAAAAEDLLEISAVKERRFDLVVVDPPRVGLHRRVLAGLSTMQSPQIIYVSCNPHTLACDLESLQEAGYRIEHVQPVDMFPQTPHCEVVVGLSKRDI